MPTQLSSGRWRTRVRDPRTKKQMSAQVVVGGPDTYATKDAARRAEQEATRVLKSHAAAGVTLREFWLDWTTDALWSRPSESTNIHNRERTSKFVETYGHRPIRSIDDSIVTEWLKGGANVATVGALRALFNDAMKPQAGRLVEVNPFAKLGLRQGRGRKDVAPPRPVQIANLLALADELTPPSYAAYLYVAVHTGMRPGELDALEWDDLDFERNTIRVERQWNAKTRTFELPKHHHIREIAMVPDARRRLLALPRESRWVFTTNRGTHYTASARCFHWNRARAAAGLGGGAFYTCTRHYFASYALNVLELAPHVIALQLGHRDGGELVRTTYGHPDAARSRDLLHAAFAASRTDLAPPLRRVA